MRTRILIGAFVSSLLIQSSVLGQGALTPPGAPAPTMKTLSQVEPRTPISSAPFVITTPGSYYLTTNLVVSSGNAITINTSGVTLDLNGFTLSTSYPGNSGTAISLSYANDVTIFNGHIVGGVTNDGSGVYSGPGFNYGIYWIGSSPQNVNISRVSVSGVLNNGIYVYGLGTSLVEGCEVHTLGNYGIQAAIIKSSSALDCGSYGIVGDQISDSHGQAMGSGGIGMAAYYSIQNSYGYATNGNNCYGIYCLGNVLNSYGYTAGSGEGIFARTAANCYGFVTAGITGSYGIDSNTAENCYAYNSGTGTGLYASQAFNCYASCTAGTGLEGFTANSCHATTSTGTAFSVTHNVNSY